MLSWTDWKDLSRENLKKVPKDAKGVYIIRIIKCFPDICSDIIYIGKSGEENICPNKIQKNKQGIRIRLNNLLNDIESTRNKWKYHSASQKIKKYKKYGLQYSWIKCNHAPDSVEKAFLLACKCSTGKLPICNSRF